MTYVVNMPREVALTPSVHKPITRLCTTVRRTEIFLYFHNFYCDNKLKVTTFGISRQHIIGIVLVTTSKGSLSYGHWHNTILVTSSRGIGYK